MRPIRLLARSVAWFLAGCVALIGFYILAGFVGGSIPVNPAWRPPSSSEPGVTIWVEDNGVHTAIVMPKVVAGVDWRAIFPPHDLGDPRYGAYDYVAVGWGERDFFLSTPTWADVRPSVVLAAALGSDRVLLHAEHIPRPISNDNVRPIRLRIAEYRQFAARIIAAKASGAALNGYGAYDAFYPAYGHYDAIRTCNAWTGATLADAGVRTGAWTPFSITVMRWFAD